MSLKGFMIASPHSGAGKTTVTLGLIGALRAGGIDVRAAKSGPDYIDTGFHHIACGKVSVNLDAWSMSADTLKNLAQAQGGELLVVEAAMGILDAAQDGTGSAADLAAHLNLTVILVVDCAAQAQSAVLPVLGFLQTCHDLALGGVILNKTGSERHENTIIERFKAEEISVLGCLRRAEGFALDSRHLGLIQAREVADFTARVDRWADIVAQSVELDAVCDCASVLPAAEGRASQSLAPLGQRIAIADDAAFSFTYPHLVAGWKNMGVEVSFFSPLGNQTPDPHADAIFLPGGYPELHGAKLAGADRFRKALCSMAARGVSIYGECGGYMALGQALIDAQGRSYEMLNLLPLVTSFEKPSLNLGYRYLYPLSGGPFQASDLLLGHEFHYASIISQGQGEQLFHAEDSARASLGAIGLRRANVAGSFAHIIAPAEKGAQ